MNYHGMMWKCFMKFCSFLPLQDKIVFSSFDGQAYSDNPRELFKYMRSIYKDEIKFVWIMNNEMKIDGATVVKNYSFLSAYHLATSKVWIDNSRKRSWIVKRKKQFYLQTWHGNVGMKKIEADAENLNEEYVKDAIHDSKIADLFISGSRWNSKIFANSFWYNGKILEFGLPKYDIFHQDMDNLITMKVKCKYGIKNDEKIFLYLPTFRDDGNTSWFNIDFSRLLTTLNTYWGGSWKALIKLHPNMLYMLDKYNFSDSVENISDYSNTSELIIASDLIITDYSSCMFDALEINKKVVLYTPDFNDYVDNRGLYWDYNELPFPIAFTNDDLVNSIKLFDDKKYYSESKHLKNEIGFLNSSNSTELISNYIYNLIWGRESKK